MCECLVIPCVYCMHYILCVYHHMFVVCIHVSTMCLHVSTMVNVAITCVILYMYFTLHCEVYLDYPYRTC